jgi:hypothetical protein
MKNLLLKARRVFSGRLTGTTCALFCTAMLTVLAVAVTSPVQIASAQTTAPAQKTPTPKPTPKRTPTPKPTPKRTPTPKPTPKHTPTPHPKFCTVCYHNKDKRIRCSEVDEFIRTHPGAKRGPCHVTSAQNR